MQALKIKDILSKNSKELVDAMYLMLLQGINQLLPIFVMPYLMIKLGAEGYGYVGFSISVIQYLIIIVDFGFNLSATKRIASVNANRIERDQIFWNVIAAKTMLLLVSAMVLTVLMLFVPTFQLYKGAIIATFPMLLGSTFTFMWFFQGIGKIRLFSIVNTISKIALLPLIFILIKEPTDYVLAAFLQAAVFVSTAFISNIYICCKRLISWVCPTWIGIKEELRVSFPLFLSSASTSVYTQLIVVVLGFFCTAAVIGKYSSAERIMRAMCFLVYTPLNQVFFPKISSLAAKGDNVVYRIFSQVRLLVFAVMALVGVVIWTSSYWLPSVLGDDYVGLDVYLKIFAFTPFAIGIGGVYGQMGLIALGNEHTSRRFRDVYFIAAIAATCMMFMLIPLFSAIGASIVVTATEMIVAVLMMYNYKKYLSAC